MKFSWRTTLFGVLVGVLPLIQLVKPEWQDAISSLINTAIALGLISAADAAVIQGVRNIKRK
jgi:hypothetical protein